MHFHYILNGGKESIETRFLPPFFPFVRVLNCTLGDEEGKFNASAREAANFLSYWNASSNDSKLINNNNLRKEKKEEIELLESFSKLI